MFSSQTLILQDVDMGRHQHTDPLDGKHAIENSGQGRTSRCRTCRYPPLQARYLQLAKGGTATQDVARKLLLWMPNFFQLCSRSPGSCSFPVPEVLFTPGITPSVWIPCPKSKPSSWKQGWNAQGQSQPWILEQTWQGHCCLILAGISVTSA